MGTTLTGTTPQDTYDSLIKVTDNGPLSGTAKYLSDGLGNDSKLALATSGVGIGTTSPVTIFTAEDTNANVAVVNVIGTSPNYIFDVRDDGASVFRVTGAGNVGIGTSSPDSLLHVNNLVNTAYDPSNTLSSGQTMRLSNLSTTSGISTNLLFIAQGAGGGNGLGSISGVNTGTGSLALTFATRDSGGSVTERMRISSAGNVGIGTSSPASKLAVQGEIRSNDSGGYAALLASSALGYSIVADTHVNGGIAMFTGGSERARFTANGLTFNGDTAAANALDDYEEGTWTMGVSFGGASTGVTYNLNTGAYTKVGNKVTVTGFLQLSSKGSSSGVAKITGLPFTIPANLNRLSAPSLWFNNITFANQFQGYCDQNSTNIDLYETTEAGVATALTNADFANNSEIMLSATYFV